MTKSNARWCAKKTQNLIILYYMGLSSKELSAFFETTHGALQKKLDRLGVKPNSVMSRFGYDPKENICEIQRHLPLSLSSIDIYETLKKCKQSLGITLSHTHEELIDRLVVRFPLVFRKKRIKQIYAQKTIGEESNICAVQWKSLKEICQFLNTHHVYPKPLAFQKYKQAQKMGFTHFLNQKLVRPGFLLITANKINEKNQKPIFYLKNYTEY